MKKIAVFGKPGSGKSTLSRDLASATGIQLHQLDSILYKKTGEQIDRKAFVEAHENMLSSARWIIDGLGPMALFNKRLEAADTLIYIDLPYVTSYWFVTKRLLKGLVEKPEGWPDGSSIVKGTLQSYQTLRRCPEFWNENFMQKLNNVSLHKSVYIIQTTSELNGFVHAHI
ncbi:hypothetical protein [Paremcibacter congregatus]|uniref:hypothetical protein n=1 Tax=Paremcibacter congregatus TaxID=2043170 RepID=UPI0030EF06D2|tara:strand:+ start:8532 stop:9044 length:513 start_codon:yes stop_codon:yes gene_type:complete